MTREDITFRAIEAADLEFLFGVYADTRREEMQLVEWSGDQKDAFLKQQFHAQHTYYQQQSPAAAYDIILAANEPVGRLYVDRREDEIRIIDIALLTEHRGRGIGGRIIRNLLAEAAAANKPVRIHVERNNRALHLYDRLGFRQTGDTGVYFLMEWTASIDSHDSKT